MWVVFVNPSPKLAPLSSMAATARQSRLRLASPHLTGAAPPTPASAHLPTTPPPRMRSARLPRPGSRSESSLQKCLNAFPPSAATVVWGGGREGAGGGGEEGGRWVSARTARPSWFPGCARRWRSSCSCCSSGEDGGRVGACPNLRV